MVLSWWQPLRIGGQGRPRAHLSGHLNSEKQLQLVRVEQCSTSRKACVSEGRVALCPGCGLKSHWPLNFAISRAFVFYHTVSLSPEHPMAGNELGQESLRQKNLQ